MAARTEEAEEETSGLDSKGTHRCQSNQGTVGRRLCVCFIQSWNTIVSNYKIAKAWIPFLLNQPPRFNSGAMGTILCKYVKVCLCVCTCMCVKYYRYFIRIHILFLYLFTHTSMCLDAPCVFTCTSATFVWNKLSFRPLDWGHFCKVRTLSIQSLPLIRLL